MTTMTTPAVSSNRRALAQEATDFFAANPDIDAIDIIFTNMCGVPRGKRLRQHEVSPGATARRPGWSGKTAMPIAMSTPFPAPWSAHRGWAKMPRSS
jgi:hypothetical protein